MRVWRISNYADLSGMGGVLAAGRWNHQNTPIVYCADHPASAMLEMLVHFDFSEMPANYRLIEIDVPDGVAIERPALPDLWRERLDLTRDLGSTFVRAQASPVMAVPSVIVPFATNYLLSAPMVAMAGITIAGVTQHPVDARLSGRD